MKKLLITFTLIASVVVAAQTTSSSKETSRTTSSVGNMNSESSITRSGDSYKFDAQFNKDKGEKVRALLMDRLGTSYLRKRGNTYEWERENGGDVFFSCRLTDQRLNFSLNRGVASYEFYDLIDEMGDDLRDIIQGHKPHTFTPHTPSQPTPPQPPANPNSTDPQTRDQELKEAERELLRAQQRVERLKKKKGN